jgi:transcriptional regulator with XRE-family HTH domain
MTNFDSGDEPPKHTLGRLAPDRVTRLKHWGNSLEKRIRDKEWNQSEFAARAAMFTRRKKFGRDLVSNYCRGVTEPSPLKQAAMARAFGISVEELMSPLDTGLPDRNLIRVDTIELRTYGKDSAWIKIDKEVPWSIGVEIVNILKSERYREKHRPESS